MAKGLKHLDDLDIVFRALAHAQRRHILVVLKARGGQMTAGEIAARFECSWPTTSRHLRQLEEAELVTVIQDGREWRYSLNADRLKTVAGEWIEWFESERSTVS